ncbi:MAG: hypothetical protein WCO68_00660 [Verrucomicrobiota bacterium]
MKNTELWKMAALSLGLAALLSGCSTTNSGTTPVGEKTVDAAPSNAAPDAWDSNNAASAAFQRTWPFGMKLAAPTLH